MNNKEDIFLIGLIIVIIILVVALFMVPQGVLTTDSSAKAQASVSIANPPLSAITQEKEETVVEPETLVVAEAPKVAAEKPVAEPAKTSEFKIGIKFMKFDDKDLTIKSGDTVTWINNDGIIHGVDLTSYGKHTYSPKLQPGESWSIMLTGPTVYYFNCIDFADTHKGRVIVEGQ